MNVNNEPNVKRSELFIFYNLKIILINCRNPIFKAFIKNMDVFVWLLEWGGTPHL
jgi:hypothetical protein